MSNNPSDSAWIKSVEKNIDDFFENATDLDIANSLIEANIGHYDKNAHAWALNIIGGTL